MKPSRSLAAALALCALATGETYPAHAAKQAAQDDPFEKLKSYDFQARAPIEAIRLQIDQALQSKSPTTEIETKLDGVLDDANATFAGKQEAARLLWIIGTGKSVPSLSKLLNDDKTADVARYALERDTDPSAAKALRAALTTTKGNTLIGVINSLGDRGDAQAAGPLTHLAKSPEPLVVEAAVSALGKIGTPAAISALSSLPATDVLAGRALVRAEVHQAALGAKAPASAALLRIISSARPDVVRGEALKELNLINPAEGSEAALAALKSTDIYIQEIAARLAGSSAVPAVSRGAVKSFSSLPASSQVVLLTAFADRVDVEAGPLTLEAMKSADPSLRQAGIAAAARIGGKAAVAPLVEILIHGEGGDRDAARDSLARMTGAEADKAILDLAKSGPPEVQAGLMRVLAQRPTPAVIAALTASATGGDSKTAVAAIHALREVGGPAEEVALVKLIVSASTSGSNSDANNDVLDAARDAVVTLAKRFGNADDGAAPVLAALSSAGPRGQAVLVSALADIGGDKALGILIMNVGSKDALVRQAAISGLADTWGDSRPLPTLLELAKADTSRDIQIQALRGYLRLVGQDDGIPGADRLNDVAQAIAIAQRPEEKRQALSVLRDARVPGAVDLAAKQLDDPDTFNEAADAVLYLAAKQRKNNRDLQAVIGPATNDALDKIIRLTKDDGQRDKAQKLKT